MHIINCKYQLCRLLIFNVLISFSDILTSVKIMQDSGKKCFLVLKVPYTIQEDQSKLDALLKEFSCLWSKICVKVSCLTGMQLAEISFIQSRLCVSEHFPFGMEDSWCSCLSTYQGPVRVCCLLCNAAFKHM